MISKAIRYINGAYVSWKYPNAFKVYRNQDKVIAYYGYLDDYNYGDIMVYQAAAKLLPEGYLIIPMKRRMPLLTKEIVMRMSDPSRKLIIGGGTLMGSNWERKFIDRFVSRAGGRLFIHGTGSTSGIADQKFWRSILGKANYGGVRGKLSQQKVNDLLGLQKEVVGDAAFGLFDETYWESDPSPKANGVLLNMGTHHAFDGMENSRNVIAQITAERTAAGERVSFLPMHQTDVELAKELKASYPELVIFPIPKTINEAIDVLQQHEFAFGERLHFIVLAILAKIPFISVNYRPKHLDLLETVNLLQFGYDAKDVSLGLVNQQLTNAKDFDWADCFDRLVAMRDLQKQEYERFLA